MADSNDAPLDADYIIVGAGMSGLSAALRIKELEPDAVIRIVEPAQIGGRAASGVFEDIGSGRTRLPAQAYDKGGHWLHPRPDTGTNPLERVAEQLGIIELDADGTITRGGHRDRVAHVRGYDAQGNNVGTAYRDIFENGIDWSDTTGVGAYVAAVSEGRTADATAIVAQKRAQLPATMGAELAGQPASLADFIIREGKGPDEIALAERGTAYFDNVWFGGDRGCADISAKEAYSDGVMPGGVQLTDGMGQLPERLADRIGRENFILNTKVSDVTEKDGVQQVIMTSVAGGGEARVMRAAHVISAVPLSALQRGDINLHLDAGTEQHLGIGQGAEQEGLQKAYMGKIVLRLDPEFYAAVQSRLDVAERGQELHIDLPFARRLGGMADEPPLGVFVHVEAGKPELTIFGGGETAARYIERLSQSSDAMRFAEQVLSPVPELAGIQGNMIDVHVTGWTTARSPYQEAAYSLSSIHADPALERQGPITNRNNPGMTVVGEFAVPYTDPAHPERGSVAATIWGAAASGLTGAEIAVAQRRQEKQLPPIAVDDVPSLFDQPRTTTVADELTGGIPTRSVPTTDTPGPGQPMPTTDKPGAGTSVPAYVRDKDEGRGV